MNKKALTTALVTGMLPGWKVDVKKTKLAKPVKTDDGEVTEQVSEITWTGDGKTGIVKPGEFRDFGLSVGMPDKKPGSKLTFKALQTYQGGEVVRDDDGPSTGGAVLLRGRGKTAS